MIATVASPIVVFPPCAPRILLCIFKANIYLTPLHTKLWGSMDATRTVAYFRGSSRVHLCLLSSLSRPEDWKDIFSGSPIQEPKTLSFAVACCF